MKLCRISVAIWLTIWLSIVGFSHSKITSKRPVGLSRNRHLVDSYEFRNENFYDQRTAAMRDFLENLRSSNQTLSEQPRISTRTDPDNSATTGNAEQIQNVNDLLPAFDTPVVDQDVHQSALRFQLKLKKKLDRFSLDIFSEDPNVFLGESDSYYLIMKKRGMLFYYLSRVVIYGLLAYLLLQFIFYDFQKARFDLNQEAVPKRLKFMSHLQIVLISVSIGVSVGLLFYLDQPRTQIIKVFSDLFFTFKTIESKLANVIDATAKINGMSIPVPGDMSMYFTIQDRLSPVLDVASSDLYKVNAFLDSSSQMKYVSNNVPAISVGVAGVVLAGLFSIGKSKKSPTIQLAVMITAASGLGYLLHTLDMFVGGLSGMNDFCLSILRYGQNEVLANKGFGVANQLGCSAEPQIFQQLYVNVIAQNSALAIYNSELKIMGREPVKTPGQAIKMTSYLRSLDLSNSLIEDYTAILGNNAQIISDLLSLNGCNYVRKWIDGAQSDLCLASSRKIERTLSAYLVLCVLFGAIAALGVALMWSYTQLAKKKRAESFLMQTDYLANKFLPE